MFSKTSKAPVQAVARLCPKCGSFTPGHVCPGLNAQPSTGPSAVPPMQPAPVRDDRRGS